MKEKKKAEFYYRAIADDESAMVLLGTEYVQEYPSRLHYHNLMEIAICRKGRGEIQTEKRKVRFSEGTIMVVPANETHAIICKDETESFWEYLYINPLTFLKQIGFTGRDRKLSVYFTNQQLLIKNEDNVKFLSTEVNLIMDQMRVKEYGYSHCIRGLVYALLMELVKINHELNENAEICGRHEERASKHITRALEYIENHYYEGICTNVIAKESFVSATTLRKLFHEYFKMSPTQYVNYTRIQKACELIRHTDNTIAEIAGKVGYENLSTFINNFKLYTGETPSRWKEKN